MLHASNFFRIGSRTVLETRLRQFEDMSLAPYKAAAEWHPSATHAVCQNRPWAGATRCENRLGGAFIRSSGQRSK